MSGSRESKSAYSKFSSRIDIAAFKKTIARIEDEANSVMSRMRNAIETYKADYIKQPVKIVKTSPTWQEHSLRLQQEKLFFANPILGNALSSTLAEISQHAKKFSYDKRSVAIADSGNEEMELPQAPGGPGYKRE